MTIASAVHSSFFHGGTSFHLHRRFYYTPQKQKSNYKTVTIVQKITNTIPPPDFCPFRRKRSFSP
jgi:hypothetical protein